MKITMKAIAAVMLSMAMVFAVGCKPEEGPNNGDDNGGGNNGGGGNAVVEHAYVDLGLPSGLLWATCNVGAKTPEEFGDYFAWGETETKTFYNWETYKYCKNADGHQLTKYCNDPAFGFEGFTDDLTTLLPEDDAATANWGEEWRMPTKDDWEELCENTTNTWTTQNGVNGRLFTAPNGNSLFLPAAGHILTWNIASDGVYGYYYSSSLEHAVNAWYFFLREQDAYMFKDNRLDGQPVRPVRSAPQK